MAMQERFDWTFELFSPIGLLYYWLWRESALFLILEWWLLSGVIFLLICSKKKFLICFQYEWRRITSLILFVHLAAVLPVLKKKAIRTYAKRYRSPWDSNSWGTWSDQFENDSVYSMKMGKGNLETDTSSMRVSIWCRFFWSKIRGGGRQHSACFQLGMDKLQHITMEEMMVKNPDFLSTKRRKIWGAHFALAQTLGNMLTNVPNSGMKSQKTRKWTQVEVIPLVDSWSWMRISGGTYFDPKILWMIGNEVATPRISKFDLFNLIRMMILLECDAWDEGELSRQWVSETRLIFFGQKYSTRKYELIFWINNYKKW